MKPAGLYLHFPFCRRACFYCHFFKKAHRPERVEDYLAQLRQEMRLRRDPGLAVNTVYFGGGSPSLLNAGQVSRLLETAAKHFAVDSRSEVTLEANPEDLFPARLRELRRAGINRLSIGAQSFQDRDLRFLKRNHDAARSIRALEAARETGFANTGMDLMIGLPTQSTKSMEANFRTIAALRPAHVSAYILEGVPRPAGDRRDSLLYFQARGALSDL
ncbi:MAG: radical SAM protein, partial [Candidatus Aminicenantes bacterium]|nr:radical SAM protein [Candidatus Aminicenantes bacterium]